MNIFIYCVFGVVAILLIIQIVYITIGLRNPAQNKQYAAHITEISEKTIHAVETGEIRKHILGEHSPEYNNTEILE